MIRVEITCAHASRPRARDAKNPCDSTRGRPLAVDIVGVMDDAKKAVRRQAEERDWHAVACAEIGRRKAYICSNCYRRERGEI